MIGRHSHRHSVEHRFLAAQHKDAIRPLAFVRQALKQQPLNLLIRQRVFIQLRYPHVKPSFVSSGYSTTA